MKIKNCRVCKSKKLKKLFSLGKMCFTGKFPNERQEIQKQPIELIICGNCNLVQLGHNFDLKYLVSRAIISILVPSMSLIFLKYKPSL